MWISSVNSHTNIRANEISLYTFFWIVVSKFETNSIDVVLSLINNAQKCIQLFTQINENSIMVHATKKGTDEQWR